MFMEEKLLKEGVLYKQARYLKTWKSRYFIITRSYFAYYKKFKTEKPRRSYKISEFDVQWKGEGKKRFYIFELEHKDDHKKNMTLRCPSQRDAEDWVRCFAQIFEEEQKIEETEGVPEAKRSMINLARHIGDETPKWAEEVSKLLKSSENWELTGDNMWRKDKMCKKVFIANANSDTCIESVISRRGEWDFVLKDLRKISSPRDNKLYHGTYQGQNVVLLIQVHLDLQFQVLINIETVEHIYYPSKISFHEIFSIVQHPFQSNSVMFTYISDSLLFHNSLAALKNYVEIMTFKASTNELNNIDPIETEIKEETDYSKPMDFNKYFIYGPGGDYERDPVNGGLILKDLDLISKQRGVLSNMIKRMGRNLLTGKSIMNISMPAYIFSEYSLLQQLGIIFGYCPIFLEKATQYTGLERFKYVLTFVVSVLHLATSQKKAYNPIIGETFQGYLGKAQIFAEQVSHHPPISSFQIYGENYYMDGFYEFMANTSANSVKARQKGLTKIIVDKSTYYVTFPFVNITGTIVGKRYYNWQGTMSVVCVEDCLYSEISFNPDKKGAISGLFAKAVTPSDFFVGRVQRIKPTHPIFTDQGKKAMQDSAKKSFIDLETEVEAELAKIEGYWTLFLDIDNKRYWSFDEYRPYLLAGASNPLPSDSTYRKDLKAMIEKNLDEAQVQKDILENIQRRDAKLRHDKEKHK